MDSALIQKVYPIRLREINFLLSNVVVVGFICFGNFLQATGLLTGNAHGLTLLSFLHYVNYVNSNAEMFGILLTILPVISLILMIVPNFALRLIGFIAVVAEDIGIIYLLSVILDWIDAVQSQVHVTINYDDLWGISSRAIAIAAVVSTVFDIAYLIVKR